MSLSGRLFPESFNDFLSWEVYDALPKVCNVDVAPSFIGIFKLYRPNTAWHLGNLGVHPHTR